MNAATTPTGTTDTTPGPAQPSLARLKTVVLLSGAALMGLEMAGVRLLEPHFGSTIYVWGSIIGVFLGALALGYWTGGMLADRAPRLQVLGGILLAAAGLTFLVPPTASALCRQLTLTDLDPRMRALIASSALYALPSVLLGMVSPFAVKLAARGLAGVGSVAGTLYALSTVGSIVGTFLVAFVLTEWIGTRWIVFGIGATMVVVSIVCFFPLRGAGRGAAVAGGLVLAVAGGFGAARAQQAQHRHVLAQFESDYGVTASWDWKTAGHVLDGMESAYHQVTVVQSRDYQHQTQWARYLIFNNLVQSGIELGADGTVPAGPVRTACSYTRWLHLGVLVTGRAPERVLVIGCGGGLGPQAFADDYAGTVQSVDVVDIDPAVFTMARRWFRFPAVDGVIRAHVDDGRVFLTRSREKWDYIVLDAFSSGNRIPRHLVSREFFALAQEHLNPGGVVVANIISAQEGPAGRLYGSVGKTMQAVFGRDQVWGFPRSGHRTMRMNIILVGRNGSEPPPAPDTLRARWESLSGRLIRQTNLGDLVALCRYPLPESPGSPVLVDDYCPTDSMVAW